MKLRILAVAVLGLSLQGCLVVIPGKAIEAVSDGITGAEGAHCVAAHAKVGDRVKMPYNGMGVIKSLSGTSIRCTDAEKPIRAMIVIDETWGKDGKYGDMESVCLPVTAKVGDPVGISGNRNGKVKSIYGAHTACSNPDLPLRALAVPA